MMKPISITRREVLAAAAALGGGALLARGRLSYGGLTTEGAEAGRKFHVCLSPEALEADPELPSRLIAAGVTRVWLCGFFYGHWPYAPEKVRDWRARIEKAGMASGVINLALGHPGDSLGSTSGSMPLTPPKHWKLGTGVDGKTYAGTSLHAPATEENARAMALLAGQGVRQVFLDDDFRLARSPGAIGGCFCTEHRAAFLAKAGYAESARDRTWADLLDAIGGRRLTPEVRAWIDFSCDELTACFRAIQAAAPEARLGVMVMYLGSEKAGIRLSDYRDTPMRVGEFMFDDGSFGSIKGKTDELFSALFHRRFVTPDLAYSETTAFPSDRLSAKNMAAKFCVSTIADVRNTMVMSGLSGLPRDHWRTLGPAMKAQQTIHAKVAGHTPRGPFKHHWGEAARLVGDDRPNSLFLASGVPFEVCDEPGRDGFTFLCDADARSVAEGRLKSPGTTFIARAATKGDGIQALPETLEAMFELKRRMLPALKDVPVVEQDKPVVCAWYPTARSALLWNLGEAKETFTVRLGDERREIAVEPLGTALVEKLGA